MKGINLGGWFVLEGWMNSHLFNDIDLTCRDETCFTKLKENAFEHLLNHHRTWITDQDIIWIKNQEFDLVRIPVPWWFLGEDGYARSVEILDEKLKMINDLNMNFMIDLHTAPGCQNGFDNGGIEHVLTWHLKKENLDKTKEVLVTLMKRYDHLKHFQSIEILNEPFVTIDIELIKGFYLDVYKALRNINQKRMIVFHDAFRLNEWTTFFKNNHFYNVALDTHMYQCYDKNDLALDIEGHVKKALNRSQVINRIQMYVPLIIGEWSLGLRLSNKDALEEIATLKAYYDAQIEGMKNAYGHIFWNYKIDSDTHVGWNFKNLKDKHGI